MLLPALPLWTWLKLYFPIIVNELVTQIMLNIMVTLALLAFLMVAMVPLNWYLEDRADRFMVDVAGKASAICALLAIVNREEFEISSEDHLSVSERVKRILKY